MKPIFCFIIMLFSFCLLGQTPKAEWVESTLQEMTEEEKIAQLFMIRAHSNLGADHIAKVEKLVKDYQVGGLCFFQGTPEKQARLTNKYQSLSKIPLLISMDAEWGLGMRLKSSTLSFPDNMTLGAIQNNNLVYEMGQQVARHCRRLGVHVNFSPVVDVNNNADNPVINYRSFGEDRYNVAVKAYMMMKGMQDENVMACAKHFPGHGDTNTDSHYDLPIISHDRNRLDSIEMFPFRLLAQQGVQSMMVAHLHVPAIDNTPHLPTTLSKKAVTGILKEEMGFDGLIFTDGLGMKGVTKHFPSGELEAMALEAGNDILLLPQDVPAAMRAIKRYIAEGKLSSAAIEDKVRKVLMAKYDLQLSTPQRVEETNLRHDLNNPEAIALQRKLIENAITLVRNKDEVVPLNRDIIKKVGVIGIGTTKETPFEANLERYGELTKINVAKEISNATSSKILRQVANQDLTIVALHDMSSSSSKDFGITPSTRKFLSNLNKNGKVLLVVFGNPYALKFFDDFENVIVAYDKKPLFQEITAQAIMGVSPISGKLPITASARSTFNTGLSTNATFKLGYAQPESVGMNSMVLNKIDELAEEAIRIKATPGCVVLVAKDNKIIFEKAYGHHTYSKSTKTRTSDIFDLASITKIAAGTISIMKLYEEGKINLDLPASQYLPELAHTEKRNLTLYSIMSHKAGLKPWIPFFEQTLTASKRNPQPSKKLYKSRVSGNYNIPVTEKLYMDATFIDTMWRQIFESPLRQNTHYKYSDLGFYMVNRIVENTTGKSLDDYAKKHFYEPLHLDHTTFNPWKSFSRNSIVPTERDNYWRRQKIQGYVHDMGAAMLGGVSGHAGLFSDAHDLAVLMQMLLNGGYYGGKQYLLPETIQRFTTRHYDDSRRGIGFDMKELDDKRSQNMGQYASANTFGHLGFTGTCVWADPDHNLVYVFLSNRTYPSMRNNKLGKEDFRPRIQDVIYEAMLPQSL